MVGTRLESKLLFDPPTSGYVQVFGRRHAETLDALGRPASEKRQGRKSRSVVQRRCGVRYGDLAAGLGLMRLDRSRYGCRFAVNRGWSHRGEVAIGIARRDLRWRYRPMQGTDANLFAAGGEPAGMASIVAVVDRR